MQLSDVDAARLLQAFRSASSRAPKSTFARIRYLAKEESASSTVDGRSSSRGDDKIRGTVGCDSD
jgi:hypothetical protein